MARELALLGGRPVRTQPFPAWPLADEREAALLHSVLESGVWSRRGPRERDFEERFSEFCGSDFALCVSNGSVALELALRALGVGPGDEVIVPALTWPATAWAAVQVGATPVFADVRRDDWCLDPESMRRCLTPRTRAVIPVHLYDQVAEMDAILAVAAEASLWVVEDCAHAHGSRWRERGAGTLGEIGTFSFQEQKALSAGEGGALVTRSPDLADRLHSLKDCGRPRLDGGEPGFGGNYRITEFQAAILTAQLDRLPAQMETRAERRRALREQLASVPGVEVLPRKPEVTRQGMYAVSLRYDPEPFRDLPRHVVLAALRAEGIPIHPPYPVVYRSELWRPGRELLTRGRHDDVPPDLGLDSRCPVAEQISEAEGLTLAHQLFLASPEDVVSIAEAFAKVQRHASELRSLGRKERAAQFVSPGMRWWSSRTDR